MLRVERATTDISSSAPVVVTVGALGEVLDIVGELEYFCSEADGSERVIRRLLELLVGDGDPPDIVPALEITRGRFVDIHIVMEDDTRHFVLLDASTLMSTLRHRQQLVNDVALERDRARRPFDGAAGRTAAMPRYRGMSALAAVISEMRGPLVEVLGQARALERGAGTDEATLRAISAIRHAAIRLDAMCLNGLTAFGDPGPARHAVFDTQAIATFVQDAFQLQARMQGVALEVRAPEQPVGMMLDDAALRLMLTNLLVRAFDRPKCQALTVTLSPDATRGHLDIEIGCEPEGFTEACFGDLITAAAPRGNLELTMCRAALTQMRGRLELVETQESGLEIWFRVPFEPTRAEPADVAASDRPEATRA